MMVERLIIVLILLVGVGVVSLAVQRTARRRAAQAIASALPESLTARLTPDSTTIVYFHGRHCGECVQQIRELESLAREQAIGVLQIDAAVEAQLSDALGVMTVPSTVIVDRRSRVHAVNLGFRPRTDLRAQVLQANAAG